MLWINHYITRQPSSGQHSARCCWDDTSPQRQCAANLDRNLKPRLAIMRQFTSVTDRQTDTDILYTLYASFGCILTDWLIVTPLVRKANAPSVLDTTGNLNIEEMPAGRGNSFADSGLLRALFKHTVKQKFLCSTVLTFKILRSLFASIVKEMLKLPFRNNCT